ncbi:hypothetical protein GW17_00050284 [Ensete ventricosum]|nr:hypothetical protein GW17_00050284 [Ensete ventricosum]
MSSSWFYKLKEMGRGERSQSTHGLKKKSHQMQQLKQHDCLPSRAFYRRRTEKLHRSPINTKASDTHFPVEPPKKPKPESRRKALRPCISAATSVSCSCRHTSTSACKSDDSSTMLKSSQQETAARRPASGSHGIKQRAAAAATPSENLVVVKSSSEPMRDFMESMVEMIVENNISDAEDLGELLACYLSLNSREYHEVIINVDKTLVYPARDRYRPLGGSFSSSGSDRNGRSMCVDLFHCVLLLACVHDERPSFGDGHSHGVFIIGGWFKMEDESDDGHSLAFVAARSLRGVVVDGAADGRFSEANSRTRWMHRRKDAMTK